MGLGRQDKNQRQVVHHTFSALNVADPVTSLGFFMDQLAVGINTANIVAPRAMRLRRVAVHSGCLVVNSAGNWTLRLRKNESGSDTTTFSIGVTALPGSKEVLTPTVDVILQPGETYHVVADGPSRNTPVIRVNAEWELL